MEVYVMVFAYLLFANYCSESIMNDGKARCVLPGIRGLSCSMRKGAIGLA